nr:trypsin-like [Ciona intestinalis]|eukprot:XP_009860268.1 trypsin-like [Ciona intestinalis]
MAGKVFILLVIAGILVQGHLCDDKIIGGISAVPHSAPHIVHLDKPNLFCGGSLIEQEWVISAAHCYTNPSYFTVVLGDHDLSTDEGTEQIIKPSKVFVHPRYDPRTKGYDVMLIKLTTPAVLNQYVKTAPLPAAYSQPVDESTCQVCGWGNTQVSGNVYPKVLQCVNLPVVPTSSCNDVTSYNGLITDSMFCIGYMDGGKDGCDGDSGGPAICDGVLAGVVSWGYGCAYPNFPGVYAKVSWTVDWLQAIMEQN